MGKNRAKKAIKLQRDILKSTSMLHSLGYRIKTRYINGAGWSSEIVDRNTGENRERTEWHRISITSEPLVRIAEQYLRKGSSVYIEGQLETQKWQDQSGNDRYTTKVTMRPYNSQLTMLGNRNDNNSDGFSSNNNSFDQNTQNLDAPSNQNDISNDLDDEIPF